MKKLYNIILLFYSLFFMQCGLTKQFDSTGNLESRGNIVNGLKNGNWKYYNDVGNLTKKGEYEYGIKNSLWKIYEISGKTYKNPIREENYNDGEKDGPLIYYEYYEKSPKNKRPSFIENWKDGKPNGPWIRYDDGKVYEETNYKLGVLHGLYVEYDISTDEKRFSPVKGTYKDGEKDGLWIQEDWYTTYRIETNYKNGKKDGEYKEYELKDSSKSLNVTGYYNDGIETGLWSEYNSEGKLIGEREWIVYIDKGAPNYEYSKISIERPDIYDNGQIKKEYQQEWWLGWEEKEGFYNEYYRNGELKETGTYKDDKKIGEWIFYHNNGKLFTKKIFYQKGTQGMLIDGGHRDILKDGLYSQYNKDGYLELETIYRNEIKILEKQYSKLEPMSLFSFSKDGIEILEECCQIESDWIKSEKENTIYSYGKFYSKYSDSGLANLAEENALLLIENDWKSFKNINNPFFPENLLEKKQIIQKEYAVKIDGIKIKIDLKIDQVLKKTTSQNGMISEAQKEIYSLQKSIEEIIKLKDSLINPFEKELNNYIDNAKSKLDKYNSFVRYFPNSKYVKDIYLSQIELESDLRKAQGNPYSALPKFDSQISDNSLNNKNHKLTIINATSFLGNKKPNTLALSYKGIKDSSGYIEGSLDIQIDICEVIYVPAGRYTITVSAKYDDKIKEYRSEGNQLKGGFKSFPLELAIYPDLLNEDSTVSEEIDLFFQKFKECYKGFENYMINN